jgi:methylmalonyl-CoA mutase
MADNTLQNLLETFPKPDNQSWRKVASSEIEGADPFTSLIWNGQDEIKYAPFYDQSAIASLDYLRKFHLPPDQDSFLGYRTWLNMPNISVTEELTANQIALDHLKNGADGIHFNMYNEHVDWKTLFNGIHWDYCSLSFQANDELKIWTELHRHIQQNFNESNINGTFFWKSIPVNTINLIQSARFKSLGIIVDSPTPVKQIVEALTKGVQMIEQFATIGGIKKIVDAIAFSIPIGNNFLQDVSKLKALRLLWYQIVRAYGMRDDQSSHLYIHARSGKWINEKYQPHGNMLKATMAAMASVIGGSNALTVYAEDNGNKMMERIARNVSNILREESHFNKVADPAAGAYVIEQMVNDIAQAAWEQFQSVMKRS